MAVCNQRVYNSDWDDLASSWRSVEFFSHIYRKGSRTAFFWWWKQETWVWSARRSQKNFKTSEKKKEGRKAEAFGSIEEACDEQQTFLFWHLIQKRIDQRTQQLTLNKIVTSHLHAALRELQISSFCQWSEEKLSKVRTVTNRHVSDEQLNLSLGHESHWNTSLTEKNWIDFWLRFCLGYQMMDCTSIMCSRDHLVVLRFRSPHASWLITLKLCDLLSVVLQHSSIFNCSMPSCFAQVEV